MTVQEAIEEMKTCNELMLYDFSYGEEIPYELLNESNQKLYDAHVLAIESMEKQIPKKPIETEHFNCLNYECPICEGGLYYEQEYCDECGQALKWGEEDD